MRIIFLLLVFYFSFCFAQNKVNGKGQKYGHWVLKNEYRETVEEGDFAIVSKRRFDIITSSKSKDNKGYIKIRYKNSETYITAYNKVLNSFSVNDGIWNEFDTNTGKLQSTTEYDNGVELNRTIFDKDGVMTERVYTNYVADSIVFLYFMDGLPFRKLYYTPGTGKEVYYYPEGNLNISNAQLVFVTDFISKPIATRKTNVVARNEITLKQFKLPDHIRIYDSKGLPLSLPLSLKKGDSLALIIKCSPTAASYKREDTISIITSDNIDYKIICIESAAHIDGTNITTLKELKLSKSIDKYLYFRGCGSETDVTLVDKSGKKNEFRAFGEKICPVKLSDLVNGQYNLHYGGDCYNQGYVTMTITD